MAVEQFTFPQSGDADDAEHFAAMIGQSNLSSYVETGIEFTYDDAVPEVEVSEGKGFIRLSDDVASSTGEDILEVNHVVQVSEQTVSLTDDEENFIYLEPNFDDDDSADVSAYTSEEPGDALLIGTIDTSNDEVEELNRDPSISARRLSLSDDQNLGFGEGDDYIFYYDEEENRLTLDNDADEHLADIGDDDIGFEVDLDLRDNSLDSVHSIDGGGDAIKLEDDLNITGQSIDFDQNAGAQNLVSFPVSSSSSEGTEHSYNLDINGDSLLRIYAESDGDGSIQNEQLDALATLDLNDNAIEDVTSIDGGGDAVVFGDTVDFDGHDIVDASDTIWNSSDGYIEQSSLENESVTVNAGDGLKSGGDVSLGDSTTLDIEPDDFAGEFLQDDGSDNLEVLIGRGLEEDGSGNIQLDEDTEYTFTSEIQFDSGLDVRGDIVDDTTTIWDSNAGHIEQSALANSSVTVAGNSVNLGGSTSIAYADLSGTHGNEDHDDDYATQSSLNDHEDDGGAHHSRYSDSEAVDAINNDGDHSSTASHDYFSGDYPDLDSRTHGNEDHDDDYATQSSLNDHEDDGDAHHSKYTDSEASDAAPVQSVNGDTGDVTVEPEVIEDFQEFESDGTWDKPSNGDIVLVDVIGAGAGGQSGERSGGSAARGGHGGGGGGRNIQTLPYDDVPSSVDVTVGAGGAGGQGDKEWGEDGESSSFGDLVVAQGGDARDGGSGTHAQVTEDPATQRYGSDSFGGPAEFGGGAGGEGGEATTSSVSPGEDGGGSVYGGAGGGGGGGANESDNFNFRSGGNGGSPDSYSSGGGGSGSDAQTGSSGEDGGFREGGGGGGAGQETDIGSGGDGGVGAGGGGGGAASTGGVEEGGAGGDGGDGLVRVWVW